MLKISDLIIDPRSLGTRLWLTDVIPSYAYVDGKRTDKITGYRYTTVMVDHGLEKINVRIDGTRMLDVPNSGYVPVFFTDLEVYIFWQNGQPQVGARATGIYLAAEPDPVDQT